jgi:acyl-coenzyme A synthetase/AMP-(fatty) acid ligase
VTVLPDAERWQQPSTRTFNRLLTDAHQAANMLRHLGVGRQDPVSVISPNCEELITATLAAQLAGIAAPINGALSGEHISHLVERSGARVLIVPGARAR